MKFGICIPNYGETCNLEGIVNVSQTAEELGYDSIWVTDHLLMPSQSGTPYGRIFETITTLAYLAARTSRVKLGISSLVLPMRNPATATKQLITVDVLSHGRLILATGPGWNEREFSFLGADFHHRGKIMDDSLKLLRELWKGGGIEFEGPRIKIHDGILEPKPIQEKLEIWIAGNSLSAVRRASLFGDAWHPNVIPLETFRPLIEEYLKRKAGGRICARMLIDLEAKESVDTGIRGERRLRLIDDMEENARTLKQLEQLGISYLLITPNSDGRKDLQQQIRTIQLFAEKFLGRS